MERLNSTNSVEPEGTTPLPEPVRIASSKRHLSSKLTEWQRFFLERLDHLLSVQHTAPEVEPAQTTLVSKAVYSTYLDCQSQGVGEQATERIAASGPAQPSAN
jgi:hypothetical protein